MYHKKELKKAETEKYCSTRNGSKGRESIQKEEEEEKKKIKDEP